MARSLTVISLLFQSTTHCRYRVYTKFLLTYTAIYRRNCKVLPLGITALQPQSHFHLGTPYRLHKNCKCCHYPFQSMLLGNISYVKYVPVTYLQARLALPCILQISLLELLFLHLDSNHIQMPHIHNRPYQDLGQEFSHPSSSQTLCSHSHSLI